jgi:hypothetical protein
VLASARKVAPYLPSVGRWIAGEGMDMVPAALSGWRTAVRNWLSPSEEERAAIEQAERLDQLKTADHSDAAPARPVRGREDATRLQIVA